MTCNNCSKVGHLLHQCKLPIISCGIILTQKWNDQLYFLMIRRKDSFGYIDFIRGKYNVNNIYQLQKKFDEMSLEEKQNILTRPFDELWSKLWGSPNIFNNEAINSFAKYEILIKNGVKYNGRTYYLKDLVIESKTQWTETEWEFPKGRKNYQENGLDCALREFNEETGIEIDDIDTLDNVTPFEELFIGSNHNFYKHKYFIAILKNNTGISTQSLRYQNTEVSKVEWKTFHECLQSIRSYHIEKKNILKNVHELFMQHNIYK